MNLVFFLIFEIGCLVLLLCCYGCFLYWICVVVGLEEYEMMVVDVEYGGVLFDLYGFVGVLVIGLVVFVIDYVEWSECSVVWLCQIVYVGLLVFGICYGYQLLVYVLGGEVVYNLVGCEFGMIELELQLQVVQDLLFQGLLQYFVVYVIYLQIVLCVFDGVVVLVCLLLDGCYVFCWGCQVWGVQFYFEFVIYYMCGYVCVCVDCIGCYGGCVCSIECVVSVVLLVCQLLCCFV